MQKCEDFSAKTYDLILQNNSSKEIFLFRGLEDTSETPLSYIFDVFTPTEEMQDGEYTGFLIWNIRTDVEYLLDNVVLNTKVLIGEDIIPIKELLPEVFLMKIQLGRLDTIEFIYNNVKINYLYR